MQDYIEKLDKAKERLDNITKDRVEFQAAYEKRQAEFDKEIKTLKTEIKNLSNLIFKPLKKTFYEFKPLPEIDYEEQKKRASNSMYRKRMERFEDATRDYNTDLERFFFTSWEEGIRNFFGEDFDNIADNMQVYNVREKKTTYFDILLMNDTTIVLIDNFDRKDVKDIPSALNDIKILRQMYTIYNDCPFYLALASKNFSPQLEKKCKEHGIAIIKQEGDAFVIDYEFMKPY